MKEKTKNILKSKKGITLIALVVTIVVLLILAAISISMLGGENGIITQAIEAKDETDIAEEKEEVQLAATAAKGKTNWGEITEENLAEELTKNIGERDTDYTLSKNGDTFTVTYIDSNRSYEIDTNGNVAELGEANKGKFEPKPTPTPPTGGKEMEDMTNGVIEIKWLDGTSNKVSNTPNAPKIKTQGLSDGIKMEQIIFDENNKKWIPGNEYSYIAGIGSNDNNSSKWANARIIGNGTTSYFVWIPRYAYRIIYFDSVDSKKQYQEGKLNEQDAITQGKIVGYSDSRGIVDAQGKKIDSVSSTTKIMVSEDYFMVHPAFMNGTESGFENGEWNSELEGFWVGKFETKNRAVIPGMSKTNWYIPSIGDVYNISKGFYEELNSHLLKNSEWGAVAYLTESTYGRNGVEVSSNTSSYTGGGEGTEYVDVCKQQSSTGNEYGIYDLVGGEGEYVAGYYVEGDALYNGESFANGISDEYSTAYSGSNVKTSYKYGDATFETLNWHKDYKGFVSQYGTFFERGGIHTLNSWAGIFCMEGEDGGASSVTAFRWALAI